MRVLGTLSHGIIDYAMVVALLLAPTIFDLAWLPALVAYLLAAVHLAVSLCTRYRLGVFRRIPFGVHGLLEVTVAVVLVALPWLAEFEADTTARLFYVCLGIALFALWLITDYGSHEAHAPAP